MRTINTARKTQQLKKKNSPKTCPWAGPTQLAAKRRGPFFSARTTLLAWLCFRPRGPIAATTPYLGGRPFFGLGLHSFLATLWPRTRCAYALVRYGFGAIKRPTLDALLSPLQTQTAQWYLPVCARGHAYQRAPTTTAGQSQAGTQHALRRHPPRSDAAFRQLAHSKK